MALIHQGFKVSNEPQTIMLLQNRYYKELFLLINFPVELKKKYSGETIIVVSTAYLTAAQCFEAYLIPWTILPTNNCCSLLRFEWESQCHLEQRRALKFPGTAA